jgi:DNA-binding transcriptional MerR regulator
MGLIREARWTEGGHRLYDESVFRRLSKIIELKRTKTLGEIRRILNREETRDNIASSERTTSYVDTVGDSRSEFENS